MLLRFGVSYRNFAEISKVAFVQMAAKECDRSSGRSSASRIALMTGLSRKEIRSILNNDVDGRLLEMSNVHVPAEVLRIWFTDKRFCDSDGYPQRLTWDTGPISFVQLVSCAGTNLSASAIRTELLRVGAIQLSGIDELQPLRRHFISDTAMERLTEGIQYGLRPLALTLAKNTVIDGQANLRFQRVIDSYSVPLNRRESVERAIRERLQEFSEEMDDILSEAGRGKTEDGLESAIGIGLFYYDEN